MDDDLIWWADAALTHRYATDPLVQAKYDREIDREIRKGGIPF
jgi:hypothetical protein